MPVLTPEVEVHTKRLVGERPHTPWWVVYDPSRPCPEKRLLERLQEYDRRLNIRWHRQKACWCVTRTRNRPGRFDEYLILAWRDRKTGERYPLGDKLLAEIRAMDTWKLGPSPGLRWLQQAEAVEHEHNAKMEAKWRERDMRAAEAIWKALKTRTVARP